MSLHPTILRLGHNRILKQLTKVTLIHNKSLLVHFEKLWSSRLLNITFLNAGSLHNAEPTSAGCHSTLTVWPSSQRGHVCTWCNETTEGKYLGKCTQIKGEWGVKNKKYLDKMQKPKQRKEFWKTVHVNITLSLSPKPEGKIQSFTQVYSTTPCTELQSDIAAGEATSQII